MVCLNQRMFCLVAGTGLGVAAGQPESLEVAGLATRTSRALDALVTQQGLAPAPSPQTSTLGIDMSDGKRLHTKYSLPYPYDQKRMAVLERSPYGIDVVSDQFMALNGAVSVFQQQRGTFLSGGQFDAWREDAQDAHDTIDWIVRQPWSNGVVYTVGVSAIGIGEVLLALAPSEHLKAQWLAWSPSNGHSFGYPGGAYRQDLTEGYFSAMSIPTRGASTKHVIPDIKAHEGWSGGYYENITVCRNASEPESPFCHYANVKWPMVDSAGWFDLFGQSQVEAFLARRRLSDVSVRDQHVLIVDPLGHCSLASEQIPAFMDANDVSMKVGAELASEIFAGSMSGPVRARLGRVNLFMMRDFAAGGSGSYWTSMDEFPEPKVWELFMQGDSLLVTPATAAGSAQYDYDPKDPTPMIGGNNLPGVGNIKTCGTADQQPRESRGDLASFDSAVLEKDLALVGRIHATLFVSSTAPDTDFVVTVADLSSNASMLVCHGVQRMRWRNGDETKSPAMVGGEIYRVDIDLDTTGYIFPAGHRVRVSVASAAAPFYNANSNTGAFEDATTIVATNGVHFSSEHTSKVSLPVVDLESLPENPHFTGQQAPTLLV